MTDSELKEGVYEYLLRAGETPERVVVASAVCPTVSETDVWDALDELEKDGRVVCAFRKEGWNDLTTWRVSED